MDGGSAPEQLSLWVTNGVLTLNQTNGITILGGTNEVTTNLVFQGTLNDLNAALTNLVYSGNTNFYGTDTLNILVNDLGNTGVGGALTCQTAGSISVNFVNQPPSVSILSPTDGSSLVMPTNLVITAQAADVDGTVSKVEFYRDGNVKLGETTITPYTCIWYDVPVGSFALTAVATDNLNSHATSSVVNVSVSLPLTSSLKLWFKADSITSLTNNAPVATWSDSSGNLNDVSQTDSSIQPTYVTNGVGSKAAVRFDASRYLNNTVTNPVAANAARSIIVVAKADSTSYGGYAFTFRRALHLFGVSWSYDPAHGVVYVYTDGDDESNNGSIPDVRTTIRNPFVGTLISPGISNKVASYLNGRQQMVTQPNWVGADTNTTGFTVGGLEGTSGYNWVGNVAEILVFDSVLSDADRSAVEYYLDKKYSVTPSAPSAPTALNVVALSKSQVFVSWTAGSTNQAGYRIERRAVNGAAYEWVASATAGAISYIDSGLDADTQYFYRMLAINAAGQSDYSSEAMATTFPDGADIPLSSLKIWLKADAIQGATNGAAVASWLDISGNGNNTQVSLNSYAPTYVTNAINGLPALYFNGSNNSLVITNSLATNFFTVYAVAQTFDGYEIKAVGDVTGGGSGQSYLFDPVVPPNGDNLANAGLSLGTNGISIYEYQYDSTGGSAMPATAVFSGSVGTNFNLVEAAYDNGRPRLYLNGAMRYAGFQSSRASVVAPLRIGGQAYGPFGGNVSEILIFNDVLSADQRVAVEKYLNSRYSIVTNLLNTLTISSIADQTTDENTQTAPIAFTIGEAGNSADNLILSASVSNTNLISVTNIVFGGSGSNRTVTILPSTNEYGASEITIQVADTNGYFGATTFWLTVTPVYYPPVALNLQVDTVENSPATFTLIGSDINTFLTNFYALTYTVVTQPTNGVLSGATTNLTYTPNTNFYGTDSFTYVANDGLTNSATATVAITVWQKTTHAPVADAQTVSLLEGTITNIVLTGSDMDGNSLNYSIINAATNGSLTGTLPNLTYAPNANFRGTDSFTFKVNNGLFDSGTVTVSINVVGINHAPTLDPVSDMYLVENAGEQVIDLTGISAGLPDESAQTVSISASADNTNLISGVSVSYSSPDTIGELSFTPATNAYGDAVITIIVSDDGGVANGGVNSITNTFYVSVQPVNYAPVVAISTPTNSASYVTVSNIVISATASEVNGAVQWVSFYSDSTLLGVATNSPYSITWTNAPAGNHVLTAQAVDNLGVVTVSAAIAVAIAVPPDTDYDGITDAQEILNGTDPNDPTSVSPVRLAYWSFDDARFLGERGQIPLFQTNAQDVLSWSTNALEISGTNMANLKLRDVENDGTANINLRNGTVRFWFKPNWGSTNADGSGPGDIGQLISAGSWTADNSYGCWNLAVSADGTQLSLVTQTNGAGATNFTATISWSSNVFHQVVVTYTPSNSIFYLDGAAVTNGAALLYYPAGSVRTIDGVNIGSNRDGMQLAQGQFDELEMFNYPLDAATIASDYSTVYPRVDSNLDGVSDQNEILNGNSPGASNAGNLGSQLGLNPAAPGAAADLYNNLRLLLFTPLK